MSDRLELSFHFPMPPNRNANTHESASWARLKQKYYARLDELQLVRRLPPPPRSPLMRAGITASLHLRNPMDDDNAKYRVKWPQDWLKKRGYLVDDRKPFLVWLNEPEQITDRSGREEVIIIHLVELDGNERPS